MASVILEQLPGLLGDHDSLPRIATSDLHIATPMDRLHAPFGTCLARAFLWPGHGWRVAVALAVRDLISKVAGIYRVTGITTDRASLPIRAGKIGRYGRGEDLSRIDRAWQSRAILVCD
jgi:hypothetical protein